VTAALPEWITKTREAVDLASNDVRKSAELDAVIKVKEDLEAQLQHLRPLGEVAALGRVDWWDGYDVPIELDTALRSASSKPDQRDLERASRLLGNFRSGVQAQIVERWRNHVTSRAAGAGELQGLVRFLGQGGGLDFDADHLNQLLGAVARSQGKVPTPEVVGALEEALQLLTELERLLPPQVRSFLGAAVRGGAALTALTPELLAWLGQRDLVSQFRVVPGEPVGNQDA
jgi:hypothetical protein